MSWNNSKETRRFKAEQERNKKYYEENGMTDEQIQTMFDYDKAVFLKERNFNETLTALRVEHLEDTDEDELTPFEEIVEPYHDEYDPFEFGFQNDALDAMIKQCDSIDLVIVSIVDAWQGKSASFLADVITTICSFVNIYDVEYSHAKLVKKLSCIEPCDIVRAARTVSEDGGRKNALKLVLDLYNTGNTKDPLPVKF